MQKECQKNWKLAFFWHSVDSQFDWHFRFDSIVLKHETNSTWINEPVPGDACRVVGQVDGLAHAGHVDNLPAGWQVNRLHLVRLVADVGRRDGRGARSGGGRGRSGRPGRHGRRGGRPGRVEREGEVGLDVDEGGRGGGRGPVGRRGHGLKQVIRN